MTATVLPGTEVAVFAAAVRSALSDLPPDELDELTDGLEADLTERVDESGLDLGDPAAYAEELRAAAGYPPRSARTHIGGTLPNLRTLGDNVRRNWAQLLVERPLVASIAAFVLTLRPLWWVFRGVGVHAALAAFFGVNALTWWPIALAFVVLSVQVGRGWMLHRAWVRWAMRVASVVALLAAPVLLNLTIIAANNSNYEMYEPEAYYPQGLTRDGMQIDNIFAYDAAGEPIDQVQLFDQDGNPLNLVGDISAEFWGAQDGSMVVPSGDVPGRVGWNVFPLAHANSWSDYEDDGALDESEVSETRFPTPSVKPLAGYVAEVEPAN
ncbi:MAG: hypothetical protein ABI566_01395 [Pseudolysinimonas sp.]